MPRSTAKRRHEAARLADQVVAASAAGRPDARAVAELCALCESAGLDHAELLVEATRRAGASVGRGEARARRTGHRAPSRLAWDID